MTLPNPWHVPRYVVANESKRLRIRGHACVAVFKVNPYRVLEPRQSRLMH
jgi:hypothetical protein